jgi:hypothetical protein
MSIAVGCRSRRTAPVTALWDVTTVEPGRFVELAAARVVPRCRQAHPYWRAAARVSRPRLFSRDDTGSRSEVLT